MVKLGVNIDHVATVRQARMITEPDPVQAAVMAELGGADGITVHLREDRRHIQDRDVELLRETIKIPLNLEMACAEEIVDFALKVQPDYTTLVPEKRQELTTEGGLDVIGNYDQVAGVVDKLQSNNIPVSIFIDPDVDQIKKVAETGAKYIEIHTGSYAEVKGIQRRDELAKIVHAAETAREHGLLVNAGHGLNYHNTAEIVSIPGMNEVNIGHSIIARSIFTGLERAVKDMKELINRAVHYAGL